MPITKIYQVGYFLYGRGFSIRKEIFHLFLYRVVIISPFAPTRSLSSKLILVFNFQSPLVLFFSSRCHYHASLQMPLLKLKGICLHLYKVKYLFIDEHLNRSYFRLSTLYWKYTFCLETDSSFHLSHETILFGIIFFGRDLLSTDAPMDAAHIL